ncbi:MAG TPA: extradiol ring-cleavage dioxygenase [Candidatus Bathyarchaeia archaeon]|nr:extradiol ring-cleavage dioxygenase [Candidatus Bathyarchaeia archaeon]
MALVYSCIAPHGGEIIPQLSSKTMLSKFEETRKGMLTIAKRILQARPHTIVIASPHNLRLVGKIAVVVTENSTGDLKGSNNRTVSIAAKCDRRLAQRILRESEKERLPVVGVNYGTASGPASDIRMDWGTLVPLWFVLNRQKLKSEIVIVTPSREIPIKDNFRFGRLIGRLLQRDKTRRYVFIASADQAHAHSRTGPYGYSPAASEYDGIVQDLIRENKLKRVMGLDPRFVERAKPDSLWQMTILAGVTDVVPSRSELISYQVPTYYGMACAGYEPLPTR